MNVIHIFIEMTQLALCKTVGSPAPPTEILSACRATPPLRNIRLLNPLLPSFPALPPSLYLTWQVRTKYDSAAEFSGVRAGFQSLRKTHSRWFRWWKQALLNGRQNHWDQLLGWNESTRTKDTGWSEGAMWVLCSVWGKWIIYFRKN